MMRNPNPKNSETTSEAEIVGSIDDLLIQIFVHLPLKPLIRLKLVSKHWNSIISDPKFPFSPRQLHNNTALGLILQNSCFSRNCKRVIVSFDEDRSYSPQTKHIPDTLRIFQSCNGLLLLKSTTSAKHYYVYHGYNQNKTTPLLLKDEKARERDKVVGMYLAFDPSESPHYKVVCVWELDWMTKHMIRYEFEVYSSEAGSWEEIRGGHVYTDYFDFREGVYWNGSIHWFSTIGKSIYLNLDDHDEMMPRVMPHRPTHHLAITYNYGESGGHLHCTVHHSPRGILVHEMRRDYSGWVLKYSVDDYSEYLPNNYWVQTLFCVVRGKRDEDSFLILGKDDGEIIRYNLVHNTSRTIQVKLFDFNWFLTTNSFHQYIESPCSV